MAKVVTAEYAAEQVKDGSCVAFTTAGLCGYPDKLAWAIEKRFLETGAPRNLMITHSCGCGDWNERGLNRFGHEGMVRKHIGGHVGEGPKFGALIRENKIESHLVPQGVMVHMYRQIAGKKPGVLTKVGLGTYADPRIEGCAANSITNKDEIVQLLTVDGEEYLYYRPFKIDVALIMGTTCDEDGNMTMNREALILEALSLASAVKNNGGIVIAQVEFLVKAKTLLSKDVKVAGPLIDYIVIANQDDRTTTYEKVTTPAGPVDVKVHAHMQTKITTYSPSLSGEGRIPVGSFPKLGLSERKVVARRAAMELRPGKMLNLGIGMPDGVGSVGAEEGILELMTMTTELGNFGGMPSRFMDFPATWNPDCTVDHAHMFDFYDGGGLDIAVLGMAELDKHGNVNVTKFGPKMVGPGGFVNISTAAKKVVFVGTITAGDDEYEIGNGTIKVTKEGRSKKMVDHVEQISFSGVEAAKSGREIFYVTERCTFKLINGKVTLIDIAPGMDIEKDILAHMEFRPEIAPDVKVMPKEIYGEVWGGLKDYITSQP